jgi:hypothetical protein
MGAHPDYSQARAEAREIGLRLLELSDGYENQRGSTYIQVEPKLRSTKPLPLNQAAVIVA